MAHTVKTESRNATQEADDPPSRSSTLHPVDRRVAVKTFSAFRVIPFRWLFMSSIIATLGYQMQGVALGWLVYILTGSALYLGTITTVQSVCQTIVSPAAGVLADRVERRNFVIMVRLITVAVAAALVILVGTHKVTILDLVVAAAVFGVAFGLNAPARQALIAVAVGKDLLMNAFSLLSGGMNLMRILGPAAAGLLIGVIGVQGIYGILLICYIAVIVVLIPVPQQPVAADSKSRNVIADLTSGFAYSYHEPAVLGLLLVGAVPLFFAMPYISLLPIFAENIWHSGATGYGILSAAPGVGGLVGALTVASLSFFKRNGWLILIGVLGYGLMLSAFAMAPNVPVAVVFLAFSGAMGVAYSAAVNSMLQTIIPNEMRGRIISLYQMSFGISGMSALPASALAGVVGVQATVVGCGLLTAASALVIFKLRPVLMSL